MTSVTLTPTNKDKGMRKSLYRLRSTTYFKHSIASRIFYHSRFVVSTSFDYLAAARHAYRKIIGAPSPEGTAFVYMHEIQSNFGVTFFPTHWILQGDVGGYEMGPNGKLQPSYPLMDLRYVSMSTMLGYCAQRNATLTDEMVDQAVARILQIGTTVAATYPLYNDGVASAIFDVIERKDHVPVEILNAFIEIAQREMSHDTEFWSDVLTQATDRIEKAGVLGMLS